MATPDHARDAVERLCELAEQVWGKDRLEVLRPMLEQTAEHLALLRESIPDIREESAFDVEG